mmetsp:Transcript_29863/g.86979  ORF Transcript_29863/g.86979 Transcript_29863/m.86979 type:complete len:233 (-) Transcript_29863:1007-1705(-)
MGICIPFILHAGKLDTLIVGPGLQSTLVHSLELDGSPNLDERLFLFLLVELASGLPAPRQHQLFCLGSLHARCQGQRHPLSLHQHRDDSLVREVELSAAKILPDRGKLVLQVLYASLDGDQHLCKPLILQFAPLKASRSRGELLLVVIHHFSPVAATWPAVLHFLYPRLHARLRVIQLLDLGLIFFGQEHEVLRGPFLRNDLLDHLIHVAHSRGILDFPECLLEDVNLILLL